MSSPQNQRARDRPDALAGLRQAVADLDPQAFADCFRTDGWVRVPRPEGDVVLRGPAEIEEFGAELRDLLVALRWTPSQRFVAAGQVVEEAVARVRTVPGVGWGPPAGAPHGELRVPMRVVAALHPDGEIGSLTVWVDWAALLDPLGVDSAHGAASALVAQARARDDRGLRVIESEPGSAPLPAPPPAVPAPRTPGPPRPSASALWWKQHRATAAGSAMALAAAGVIGWVAVSTLRPILDDRPSATGASPGASSSVLGAETRSGSTEGNGGTGTDTNTGTDTGTDTDTGTSTPDATGRPTESKLPVIVRERPKAKPTVQDGKPYVLQADILFETGKADLTRAARVELEKMAHIIRSARVTGTIQVNGYTDDVGTAAYNLDLSRDRSLAVAQGLRRELRGVELRLKPQGFGEPENPVTTPAARQLNRKVVIVLPDPKPRAATPK
jgi:outer membrane protein OmpA-like peptidoglycan-associated protein